MVRPYAHSQHLRVGCAHRDPFGHSSNNFFSQRQQYRSEQPGQACALEMSLSVEQQFTHLCLPIRVPLTTVPLPLLASFSCSERQAADLAALDLDFFPMIPGRWWRYSSSTRQETAPASRAQVPSAKPACQLLEPPFDCFFVLRLNGRACVSLMKYRRHRK